MIDASKSIGADGTKFFAYGPQTANLAEALRNKLPQAANEPPRTALRKHPTLIGDILEEGRAARARALNSRLLWCSSV